MATLQRWLAENPSFSALYARAREHHADALFAQCLEIADNATADVDSDGKPNNAAVQRARLQIDTRLRVAGKLHSRYADGPQSPVYVDNRSVTVDSRALEPEARDRLRQLLLLARSQDG